jgi:hypothetical protein
VADAVVTRVELLGVDAVDALHSGREGRPSGLDDQVIVVAEQAERVDVPRPALGDAAETTEEIEVVVLVEVDRRASDSARGDVVEAVGQKRAGDACHLARVRPRSGRLATRARVVTLSAHARHGEASDEAGHARGQTRDTAGV